MRSRAERLPPAQRWWRALAAGKFQILSPSRAVWRNLYAPLRRPETVRAAGLHSDLRRQCGPSLPVFTGWRCM